MIRRRPRHPVERDVERCAANAARKAESLGGTLQVMEGIEIGLFTDPEGNLVGLVRSR